jgi:hypothetical protein
VGPPKGVRHFAIPDIVCVQGPRILDIVPPEGGRVIHSHYMWYMDREAGH